MTKCHVGDELFQVDGRTDGQTDKQIDRQKTNRQSDMTKQIAASRHSANARRDYTHENDRKNRRKQKYCKRRETPLSTIDRSTLNHTTNQNLHFIPLFFFFFTIVL
jgi:hypothetical protein